MRRVRNATKGTEKQEFMKRCESNSLILPFLQGFNSENCSVCFFVHLSSSPFSELSVISVAILLTIKRGR